MVAISDSIRFATILVGWGVALRTLRYAPRLTRTAGAGRVGVWVPAPVRRSFSHFLLFQDSSPCSSFPFLFISFLFLAARFFSPSRLLVSCYFLCIDSCRWILVLILDTWSLFVDSFPFGLIIGSRFLILDSGQTDRIEPAHRVPRIARHGPGVTSRRARCRMPEGGGLAAAGSPPRQPPPAGQSPETNEFLGIWRGGET